MAQTCYAAPSTAAMKKVFVQEKRIGRIAGNPTIGMLTPIRMRPMATQATSTKASTTSTFVKAFVAVMKMDSAAITNMATTPTAPTAR